MSLPSAGKTSGRETRMRMRIGRLGMRRGLAGMLAEMPPIGAFPLFHVVLPNADFCPFVLSIRHLRASFPPLHLPLVYSTSLRPRTTFARPSPLTPSSCIPNAQITFLDVGLSTFPFALAGDAVKRNHPFLHRCQREHALFCAFPA